MGCIETGKAKGGKLWKRAQKPHVLVEQHHKNVGFFILKNEKEKVRQTKGGTTNEKEDQSSSKSMYLVQSILFHPSCYELCR
jgi:hypothetical protein